MLVRAQKSRLSTQPPQMRRKIYRTVVVVAFVGVFIVAVALSTLFYRELSLQASRDVLERSRVIGYLLDVTQNRDEVVTLTNLELTDRQLRITLIEADGTVVYDSKVEARTLPNHRDRIEVQEALKSGEGSSRRFSDTIGKETYYAARRLISGEVVRVSVTIDLVAGVALRVLPYVVAAIVLVVLGCLLAARYLTQSIIRPLSAINFTHDEAPYEELEPFMAQHKQAERQRRQFSANVSHELKTPLTSMVGRAELIENGLVRDEDIAGFGRAIRREGQRLLELIEDIMRLSELDEAPLRKLQEFSAEELVDEVFEGLAPKAAKAEVELRYESAGITLHADRSMMHELLYNLIDNAIKYNRVGGSVMVREAGTMEHPVLEVIDTGIGIPKKDHERVFERFYCVDRSRSKETGGTGLGLSIVKHIVSYHKGSIELESEPGVGTTIRIML